jgi:hypothetical protein
MDDIIVWDGMATLEALPAKPVKNCCFLGVIQLPMEQ